MARSQRMNVTKRKAETPAKNVIMEKSPPKEGSVMNLAPKKEYLKIRNVREVTFWLPKSATDDGDSVYLVGDIQGGYKGTGNINDDSLFVDSENGDYRLSQIALGQAVCNWN